MPIRHILNQHNADATFSPFFFPTASKTNMTKKMHETLVANRQLVTLLQHKVIFDRIGGVNSLILFLLTTNLQSGQSKLDVAASSMPAPCYYY